MAYCTISKKQRVSYLFILVTRIEKGVQKVMTSPLLQYLRMNVMKRVVVQVVLDNNW